MGKYGYRFYTFSVHRHGDAATRLPLGELCGEGADAHGIPRSRSDAIVTLYGLLNGLLGRRVDEKTKHLTVQGVTPAGRSVRFIADLGTSGVNSTFIDPAASGSHPVFTRAEHHIESNRRRGLIVAGTKSTVGLLALESVSGSTGTTQIVPLLKRGFRAHTRMVIDFDAVVHENALQAFLDQARIGAVTLKRSGLPPDIADQLEVRDNQAHLGRLEMKISKGRIPEFTRGLTEKFRRDDSARRRLLSVGSLDFDELNVRMEVGDRSTTLSISADRMPSFVYQIQGRDRPDDQAFYREVSGMVAEVAQAFGAQIVGTTWQTGSWSEESLRTVVELPKQEGPSEGAIE
ncbi:hypothetical protein L1857_15005 [Amycolatopsis thermalba]|uniref:Uncharacterized protein n=1 Tax=Amycolatopsis thermalba TaxID=944492 RepID=A0ABY4NVG5_9PSEU|nr:MULTISPECIES: hypothetical protein [Amycolatopsis]UQS24044.1 hypothetical protein L1857_15005 [Amycolatopsis thermalba]